MYEQSSVMAKQIKTITCRLLNVDVKYVVSVDEPLSELLNSEGGSLVSREGILVKRLSKSSVPLQDGDG